MKLISPLLKHVVYPGLSRVGYLRPAGSTGPTVLTYHGVLPAGYSTIDPDLDGSLVSADSFRRQLRFIKDQYKVISPEEFLHWCEAGHALSPRSVLLTCDDGLQNSLTDMLPILQELDLPCLFFVTGASLTDAPTMLWYEELYLMFLAASESFTLELPEIGLHTHVEGRNEKRVLWWVLARALSRYDLNHRQAFLEGIRMQLGLAERWDAEYREDPVLSRRFLVLDSPELCQLAAAANTCIGAHTMSHPMLSQSSPETAWKEISDCKLRLEHALGRKVWALAYPFGDSSSVTLREFQMAQRAGYQCAFLNVGRSFGTPPPKFALPRVHITASMTDPEFKAHISGFHESLRQLFRHANMDTAVGSNA
jgi:peptidoglycan/xylan/chitin deacetylase (PgdA/CDA1 family)